MKTIRKKVFETNSSSTHSLTFVKDNKNYFGEDNEIKIRFINTDEETVLFTLQDKVSYLVSHIVNSHKYISEDYEDLIREVKEDYNFKEIENFVLEKYNKRTTFPEKYEGDIEEIVEINHQLRENSFYDVLRDIIEMDNKSCLNEILREDYAIEFGRD